MRYMQVWIMAAVLSALPAGHNFLSDQNGARTPADGRIYLANNDGTIFVVRAGSTFELLATNFLGERIRASPPISGDELFYRTDSHLYCIGR